MFRNWYDSHIVVSQYFEPSCSLSLSLSLSILLISNSNRNRDCPPWLTTTLRSDKNSETNSVRISIAKRKQLNGASLREMPRDESDHNDDIDDDNTDITDDEVKPDSRSKSKKRNRNSVRKVERSKVTPVKPGRWIRFLQWCESSNNLSYLQGILGRNTIKRF